jgi:hypothetical protein
VIKGTLHRRVSNISYNKSLTSQSVNLEEQGVLKTDQNIYQGSVNKDTKEAGTIMTKIQTVNLWGYPHCQAQHN